MPSRPCRLHQTNPEKRWGNLLWLHLKRSAGHGVPYRPYRSIFYRTVKNSCSSPATCRTGNSSSMYLGGKRGRWSWPRTERRSCKKDGRLRRRILALPFPVMKNHLIIRSFSQVRHCAAKKKSSTAVWRLSWRILSSIMAAGRLLSLPLSVLSKRTGKF